MGVKVLFLPLSFRFLTSFFFFFSARPTKKTLGEKSTNLASEEPDPGETVTFPYSFFFFPPPGEACVTPIDSSSGLAFPTIGLLTASSFQVFSPLFFRPSYRPACIETLRAIPPRSEFSELLFALLSFLPVQIAMSRLEVRESPHIFPRAKVFPIYFNPGLSISHFLLLTVASI